MGVVVVSKLHHVIFRTCNNHNEFLVISKALKSEWKNYVNFKKFSGGVGTISYIMVGQVSQK